MSILRRGGGQHLSQFKSYTDYSIGYLTRGCFRKCPFCVNQKYDCVQKGSPLEEFLDTSRPKICLLDDNFLGYPNWKELLLKLQDTGKRFVFKQGLDERLLTDEKCKLLFNSKYDGYFIFAFDNIKDYDLIKSKLKIIRKYTDKKITFYVLCGFDYNNKYDNNFWKQDLFNTWKRIELLMEYKCYPYIMRYEEYKNSPYKGHYIALAQWCNQPHIFSRMSFEEFSFGRPLKSGKPSAPERYYKQIAEELPELANKYFSIKL